MARFAPKGLLALALAVGSSASDVAVCPGESARYGDHKCNHDVTHRVCAQLLDANGQPLKWGTGDFWEITGQKDWEWSDEIRANNGDSWCICMWATARLISSAGCDNVHLRCDSTDVSYVMQQYTDGGVDLEPAKACLAKKCPGGAAAASLPDVISDAMAPMAPGVAPEKALPVNVPALLASGAAAAAIVGLLVARFVTGRWPAAAAGAESEAKVPEVEMVE